MTRNYKLRLAACLAVIIGGSVILELVGDAHPWVSLLLAVSAMVATLAVAPRERPPWLTFEKRQDTMIGVGFGAAGAVAIIAAESVFTEEGEYLSPLQALPVGAVLVGAFVLVMWLRRERE